MFQNCSGVLGDCSKANSGMRCLRSELKRGQYQNVSAFASGHPRAPAVEAFVHYIRSDFKTAFSLCTEALQLASDDGPERPARVSCWPLFTGIWELSRGSSHWLFAYMAAR